MGKIVVVENVTLDGVMQSPGTEDDTRGGFTRGGWAAPYADAVLAETLGKGVAADNAMLFGRRTYEIMQRSWGGRTDGNPFTPVLEGKRKYVVSRTQASFSWVNSVPVADLSALKRIEEDLVVLGSGELVRSLAAAGLVDRYTLLLHPLTLGQGTTLFGDLEVRLDLEETVVTGKGVIIAFYRPGSVA
ncbi:dihydrofolate reductase family protein [Actinoplanes sp. NPDC051411]|uniref:dihydrofolate reductase family protein n=1 Tax=Actinoplanes sp. NPDC051411 TaxID=3155522 RepID=UPI00344039FC